MSARRAMTRLTELASWLAVPDCEYCSRERRTNPVIFAAWTNFSD